MGAFRATTSFFSLKPAVYGDEQYLFCESSLFTQMASLFACSHLVVLDRKRQVIHISDRTWWTRRREREVPFSRVDHVEYDFDDLPLVFFNSIGWVWRSELETFTVSIALRTPEETLPLARFQGQGSQMTGALSSLCRDPFLGVSGDQEDASLLFVTALMKMLGVPLGLPVPEVADAEGRKHRCTACQRYSPPRRAKCQYCGGRVEASGDPP